MFMLSAAQSLDTKSVPRITMCCNACIRSTYSRSRALQEHARKIIEAGYADRILTHDLYVRVSGRCRGEGRAGDRTTLCVDCLRATGADNDAQV